MEESKVEFSQVVSRGCGIDIHKKTAVATIDGTELKNRDPRAWYKHKFFDRIERMVIEK